MWSCDLSGTAAVAAASRRCSEPTGPCCELASGRRHPSFIACDAMNFWFSGWCSLVWLQREGTGNGLGVLLADLFRQCFFCNKDMCA